MARRAPERGRKGSKRPQAARSGSLFTQRNAFLLWGGGLALLIALALYPAGTHFTRMSEVTLGGLLALALPAFLWSYKPLVWTVLAFYTAIGIFLVLPGWPNYDRLALRAETAHALQRYEGVSSFKGGENIIGIDGPGILRRGAIDALFVYGMRTYNSLLVRNACAIWWRDLAASDLSRGAGGLCERLFPVPQLAGMDDSKLHLGDFAITKDGGQALSYLGDHRWIAADPNGKSVCVDARSTANEAFHRPAIINRWRWLELERLVGKRN